MTSKEELIEKIVHEFCGHRLMGRDSLTRILQKYLTSEPAKESEECKVEEKRCEQEQVAPKKIELEDMRCECGNTTDDAAVRKNIKTIADYLNE